MKVYIPIITDPFGLGINPDEDISDVYTDRAQAQAMLDAEILHVCPDASQICGGAWVAGRDDHWAGWIEERELHS